MSRTEPGPVRHRPARPVGRPRDREVDAAVLEAALDLLAEHGYAGMAMEAVAARAGVAKTTVYRRWPTKDELVFEALARLKGEVVLPPPGTVRAQLRYLLTSMRRQWGDQRQVQLMQRLAADGIDRPEQFREIRARLMAPRRAVVRACLQRAVDAGDLDPAADLDWAVAMLLAPLIVAGLTQQRRPSIRQVELTIDVVLRGMAPVSPIS